MLWWLLILFLTGASVGSFLNVVIDRLPRGQSLFTPPSHCDACGQRLRPWELVPILSYLWLRGRCRHCQAALPWRMVAVEAANGLLFPLLWLMYGPRLQLPIALVYSDLFLVIFVMDLEQQLILNRIVYPSLALAILLSPLWPGLGPVRSAAGGISFFVIMLVPFLIYRGGMGAGDVKLAALVGLVTGFPLVLVAAFVSFILGGLVAAFLLLTRLRGRREAIPFGPFLTLGAMFTLVWGEAALQWYQRAILGLM
ncbi:MAG: prepilin peptidase [Chloroflexi bacterium]|nr:prepilin peptidase [Chloroflexota bacterium]